MLTARCPLLGEDTCVFTPGFATKEVALSYYELLTLHGRRCLSCLLAEGRYHDFVASCDTLLLIKSGEHSLLLVDKLEGLEKTRLGGFSCIYRVW